LLASGCFWFLVALCFRLLAGGCWVLAAGFSLLPLLKAADTAPAMSVLAAAAAASSSPPSLPSYFSSLLHIYFFNYYIRIWNHTFMIFFQWCKLVVFVSLYTSITLIC